MRTKLVIAFMFISMCLMAQKNTDTAKAPHPPQLTAGDEFIISSEHFYTGFFLETIGTMISLFAIDYAARDNYTAIHLNSGPGGLLMAGSLMDIAGAAVMLESRVHIKRAGILLNKNGAGIAIPIGGK